MRSKRATGCEMKVWRVCLAGSSDEEELDEMLEWDVKAMDKQERWRSPCT